MVNQLWDGRFGGYGAETEELGCNGQVTLSCVYIKLLAVAMIGFLQNSLSLYCQEFSVYSLEKREYSVKPREYMSYRIKYAQ